MAWAASERKSEPGLGLRVRTVTKRSLFIFDRLVGRKFIRVACSILGVRCGQANKPGKLTVLFQWNLLQLPDQISYFLILGDCESETCLTQHQGQGRRPSFRCARVRKRTKMTFKFC